MRMGEAGTTRRPATDSWARFLPFSEDEFTAVTDVTAPSAREAYKRFWERLRTAVETQVLLIGEGADLDFLASHLEAAGYAVACTSAAEALDVIASLRPAEVMITPGVPIWQRTQLSAALVERYPDVRIVLLKKRGATPGVRTV